MGEKILIDTFFRINQEYLIRKDKGNQVSKTIFIKLVRYLLRFEKTLHMPKGEISTNGCLVTIEINQMDGIFHCGISTFQ